MANTRAPSPIEWIVGYTRDYGDEFHRYTLPQIAELHPSGKKFVSDVETLERGDNGQYKCLKRELTDFVTDHKGAWNDWRVLLSEAIRSLYNTAYNVVIGTRRTQQTDKTGLSEIRDRLHIAIDYVNLLQERLESGSERAERLKAEIRARVDLRSRQPHFDL
ncbi:hypothetical protein HYY71_06900 [Candidatus Woesearchaeota archaeon]|nr:hypothetical protein [Candidatus Woesearchaeota archaeon]